MIPLRDNNPTRSFPIVTILLILANCVVYYYEVKGNPYFDAHYAMVPRKIVTGQDIIGILHPVPGGLTLQHLHVGQNVVLHPNEILLLNGPQPLWLTIFTAMFMHGSLLHIGGNMLFLWIFGNNVEDALGKMRYLFFYLLCGVAAAVAQIAVDPNSLIPNLGASGAVAGVLGAYILLWPEAKVMTAFVVVVIFLREISAFWFIGLWIGLEILYGYTSLGGPETGGVAHFAHIGGFFAGIVMVLLMGGRKLIPKIRKRRGSAR